MASPHTAAGTRDRLIMAMAAALQRRGLHGVGLNELLSRAQAPKGVLYHHFPGGKTELAVAAVRASAERVTTALDDILATGRDPVPALGEWLAAAQRSLVTSDFERGCPLATVALESTADDVELRTALADAFASVRDRLADVLNGAGVPPQRAAGLAALVVSAYEGALMQARVAGSPAPMAQSCAVLLDLIDREIHGPETLR